jgi:RNA polymerase II C-terminal domain phosphatase-like 3/4
MNPSVEKETPMEDIEEGEIADDVETSGEALSVHDNLPTSQTKAASMNDSAASRFRNDGGRKEENSHAHPHTPRFVKEEGPPPGSNQWRGEGLRYSNGNYSSTLYNLAWAKAVQSKPTFPLETNNNDKGKGEFLKNGGGGTGGLSRSKRDLGSEKSNVSRNGRNPKAKFDDYNEFVLASGSSSSEGNDRVVTAKKGIAENGQKRILDKVAVINISDDDDDDDDDDNDEKSENRRTGDDDREEGELEEGEIDVGLGSAVGSQASSSEERFENSGDFLYGGGRIDSSRASSDRHTRYRDKLPAKGSDRSWVKDQGRQSSHHQDDGKQRLKDQDRERRLDEIAEMVKNVSVKDAQKSFVGVCHQLHRALECLTEINPLVQASSVAVGLVKQIFAGIRAAYAVRNTWSGNQQNQDKSSAFPRLLQFVNREARKLFTSKQIKELENMLLSVPSSIRSSKADSTDEEKEERYLYAMQSSQENALKPGGRERITPNFETTEAILTKSIVTLNNANEITRDSRTLKPNEYTPAPTLTETDSRSSSSNSLSACGPESSNNSCYKPLEGFEEPDDLNLPNPTREGSAADLNRRDSIYNSLGGQTSPRLSDPLDRSIQDENASWAAITSYQEKFRRCQHSISTRLPSPTPSEDGEEGEASNQGVEVSTSSGNKEPQQSIEEREMRDMDIGENVSVPSILDGIPQLNADMESQVVGPRIQTCSSEELEVPVFQSKDCKGAVETGKSINLKTGSSQKLQPKSRDPRRRVAESEFYTMDLNRHPCHADSNVITREQVVGRFLDRKHKSDDDLLQDSHNSKRLRNHADHHLFSSGFPVVTSGCGGWLEENTVIPAPADWDQTSEMEIDNTGALSRSSDLRSDSNSILATDTQNAATENRNKRQKTESFYQASTSMDPVSEANQIQPNNTDINLNPRTPSVSEEERGERKETQITEIGQQTNNSVTLNSNIIPSVLKDIAVNPTMLMHLIKQEQQKLLAQAAQKLNQCQQTNPPSGPSREFVTTSGKVIAADPSMLKNSNPQQKTALQALATASKPATQVASMAGDPGKPRMKPRDPRRILHMNSGNDNVNLNGTDKHYVPVSRQIRMASGPATTESAPKLQQVPSLPNIEQNFKEKLARIAEMLKNSEMKTLRVLSSQMSVGQSNRETDAIDLEPESIESSKLLEVDIKQDVAVPKDSSMVIPPLQSLSSENTTITQNHLNPWGDVDHLLEGLSEEQRVAIQQERARRIDEQNKMFSAKKLCLVLDLDHTLLNSAKFTEIDPVHEEILRKKEEQDREKPQRQLFRFPHMGMWTKLRPGIWNFLDRASKLYELHVYTMGNKVYATEMAKVLDPTGALFAGRVISKGDEADLDGDDRLPKSKDLDGVLGMESAVVIIDDSARVWPHHRHNLIVVERYMYFPCSRRQFGLPGLSLLEADVDERPEDGTLASSLAVIEKIHFNFFSNTQLHEVDVREFLAAEQQNILKDCKVVFSRVFPVGEAQPHLHPLWQMAEQFGAVCTTQIDDEVTHVVALAPGTDKVNWALARGRHVVHPGWLEASALLYRRANERDFYITMNHFPCPPH